MDDNETRKFGICEECDNEVTDNCDEYYVNEDGKVFCSVECVLEYYHVHVVEV